MNWLESVARKKKYSYSGRRLVGIKLIPPNVLPFAKKILLNNIKEYVYNKHLLVRKAYYWQLRVNINS